MNDGQHSDLSWHLTSEARDLEKRCDDERFRDLVGDLDLQGKFALWLGKTSSIIYNNNFMRHILLISCRGRDQT